MAKRPQSTHVSVMISGIRSIRAGSDENDVLDSFVELSVRRDDAYIVQDLLHAACAVQGRPDLYDALKEVLYGTK